MSFIDEIAVKVKVSFYSDFDDKLQIDIPEFNLNNFVVDYDRYDTLVDHVLDLIDYWNLKQLKLAILERGNCMCINGVLIPEIYHTPLMHVMPPSTDKCILGEVQKIIVIPRS